MEAEQAAPTIVFAITAATTTSASAEKAASYMNQQNDNTRGAKSKPGDIHALPAV
eukprot:CAMPEP_0204364720 /NCGR_PEP_ID=MMETSP0469-20131031/41355_1 /ASSEMBLY_ACC=CAM_ASM_000384 /TAXON_ID=2969 /ORGANISM="Oxyrrhis marina" /LENGTH=54 /DNA_ID=CAMNT_0051353669 /DNA_START=35 /DNA_END=197 /DNA_ORIENTATION=-